MRIVVAAGVAPVATAALFVVLGPTRADQLAGVLSMFLGVAGLTLTGYGILQARQAGVDGELPHGTSRHISASGPNSTAFGAFRDVHYHAASPEQAPPAKRRRS